MGEEGVGVRRERGEVARGDDGGRFGDREEGERGERGDRPGHGEFVLGGGDLK